MRSPSTGSRSYRALLVRMRYLYWELVRPTTAMLLAAYHRRDICWPYRQSGEQSRLAREGIVFSSYAIIPNYPPVARLIQKFSLRSALWRHLERSDRRESFRARDLTVQLLNCEILQLHFVPFRMTQINYSSTITKKRHLPCFAGYLSCFHSFPFYSFLPFILFLPLLPFSYTQTL